MSGTLDLERRLATWLEQDGPADVPAAAVEAALAQARTIRQQRAWLTRTWWDRRPLVAAPARVAAGAIEPAERIPTFPVARPPLRPAWVVVLLAGLLAALVGGMLVVGSQQQRRLPAVVPPVGQRVRMPARVGARQAGAGRPGPAGHGGRGRVRPPRGQAGGRRGHQLHAPHRRDVDVRRVYEHLDADASEPGAAALQHRSARLRRRLRRDDRDPLREGVGLRPSGQHLDGEGLGLARRRLLRGARGLRPALGPRRRRGR